MDIIDLKKELSLYFLYLDTKDASINYKFYQEDLSYLEANLNPVTNQLCVHLRIKRNFKSLALHILYSINGLDDLNIVFFDDKHNNKLVIPCNKHITLNNRGSYFEVLLTSDSKEVKNLNIKTA